MIFSHRLAHGEHHIGYESRDEVLVLSQPPALYVATDMPLSFSRLQELPGKGQDFIQRLGQKQKTKTKDPYRSSLLQ